MQNCSRYEYTSKAQTLYMFFLHRLRTPLFATSCLCPLRMDVRFWFSKHLTEEFASMPITMMIRFEISTSQSVLLPYWIRYLFWGRFLWAEGPHTEAHRSQTSPLSETWSSSTAVLLDHMYQWKGKYKKCVSGSCTVSLQVDAGISEEQINWVIAGLRKVAEERPTEFQGPVTFVVSKCTKVLWLDRRWYDSHIEILFWTKSTWITDVCALKLLKQWYNLRRC